MEKNNVFFFLFKKFLRKREFKMGDSKRKFVPNNKTILLFSKENKELFNKNKNLKSKFVFKLSK